MRNLLIALFGLLLTSSPLFGDTYTADPLRTVYIRGLVSDNAIEAASKIIVLSSQSKEPIDLILNSPGGQVFAGLQTISAIAVANERGVTIRCFVPMLAASMAYQIFSHCNERYTLANTMLLFHPATMGFRRGVNSDDLLYSGKRLRKLEIPMMRQLLRVMGVSKKFFYYHYNKETLWLAKELKELSDFYEIVDNFKNVSDPFKTR